MKLSRGVSLVLVLLGLLTISKINVLAADGPGDACIFLAEGYDHGQAEGITWSDGTTNVQPPTLLIADFRHFNAGDTLTIRVSPANAAINPATSLFSLVIEDTGNSITQSINSTITYTFGQGTNSNVYLYFYFGYFTAPHAGDYLYYTYINCYHDGEQNAQSGPPDNRMNYQSGDAHIAILFPTENGIDIFVYASGSYISNFITNEDIAAYLENLPSENLLIRSEGLVSVYILTTGQIQFNLGPDAEGKTYTIRMDDLSGTNLETEYFDPNE
jgi:hypothetical protein